MKILRNYQKGIIDGEGRRRDGRKIFFVLNLFLKYKYYKW